MDIVKLWGWIALVVTLFYTCFGLPVQIVKNFKTKSTEGLSLFLMFTLLFTFTSWCIYAGVKPEPDWYVIASNAPGALFALIILGQFAAYRRPH